MSQEDIDLEIAKKKGLVFLWFLKYYGEYDSKAVIE